MGAFEAMKSSGDVELAQVKNKFANPTPLGYRDMNTCVRVDLGADEGAKKHIAEVQLNLSEMLTAKKAPTCTTKNSYRDRRCVQRSFGRRR